MVFFGMLFAVKEKVDRSINAGFSNTAVTNVSNPNPNPLNQVCQIAGL